MLSFKDLRPYQQAGIDSIYENDYTLVTCPMGAGKTVITLTAISELIKDKAIKRALVIAPLRVAQLVWVQEAANWDHLRHLDILRATGKPEQRTAAIDSNADIVVLNYDNLAWFVKEYRKKVPFDMLVLDETTRLKSTKSARWKAMKKIVPEFNIRVGLTGTPTTQGIADLFGQVYCIDGGQALGSAFGKFQREWFYPTDPNGWNWAPFPTTVTGISNRIKHLVFQIEPDEYANQFLYPLVTNRIHVDLPPVAKAQYKTLKKEMLLQLENKEITAPTAGVLSGKLHQISNGFAYDEEKNITWLHNAKLDALNEVLEEQQGAPTLVIYKFKAELDAMKKLHPGPHLGGGTSQSDAVSIISDWNEGKLPVLYLHPMSAGHGVNLQYGGNTIVWYGLTFSLEEYQQTVARLHRGGQKGVVWNHVITANGTIDAHILKVLEGKLDMQTAVMENLKS